MKKNFLTRKEFLLSVLFMAPMLLFGLLSNFSIAYFIAGILIYTPFIAAFLLAQRRIGSTSSMKAPRPDGSYYILMNNSEALNLFILPIVLAIALSGASAIQFVIDDEVWSDGSISMTFLHALFCAGWTQIAVCMLLAVEAHTKMYIRVFRNKNSIKNLTITRLVFLILLLIVLSMFCVLALYAGFFQFFPEIAENVNRELLSFFDHIGRGFLLYLVASVTSVNLSIVFSFRLYKSASDKFRGNHT